MGSTSCIKFYTLLRSNFCTALTVRNLATFSKKVGLRTSGRSTARSAAAKTRSCEVVVGVAGKRSLRHNAQQVLLRVDTRQAEYQDSNIEYPSARKRWT